MPTVTGTMPVSPHYRCRIRVMPRRRDDRLSPPALSFKRSKGASMIRAVSLSVLYFASMAVFVAAYGLIG